MLSTISSKISTKSFQLTPKKQQQVWQSMVAINGGIPLSLIPELTVVLPQHPKFADSVTIRLVLAVTMTALTHISTSSTAGAAHLKEHQVYSVHTKCTYQGTPAPSDHE